MKILSICTLLLWTILLPAGHAQKYFTFTTRAGADYIDPAKEYLKPDKKNFYNYEINRLRAALRTAPHESAYDAGMPGLKLSLPNPDGGLTEFDIYESPVMADPDYSRFPNIRTYIAVNQRNKIEHGRIDITEQGFHGMILTDGDVYFIEPATLNNHQTVICYYKSDNREEKPFTCETLGTELLTDGLEERAPLNCNTSMSLISYRTAVACTVEYGTFHGGTVALALSAITTTVNRVNTVYENDLGIRLILIGNNSSIIYTTGNGYTNSTDPYSNGNGSTMLSQNQSNLNSVIGSANYDIGHVVSTGGGGVAYLGCVCSSSKAGGVTGSGTPIGDVFDIDYVAHEMGHQFGGDHTFNGSTGSCSGGNREASSAYEPGSGSTIQAYAGICSPQDIQPHSDAYFAHRSLFQMLTFTNNNSTGGSCESTVSGTNNNSPQLTSYTTGKTIPANTPFYLDATATDPNGDAITYCWEEADLGPAGNINPTSTTAPIFRTFYPTSSGIRYFPRMHDILNNVTTYGEVLPAVARTLNFTISARDNHATGGGVCRQNAAITVVANSGFAITAPNTATTWSSPGTGEITWNVSGTTAAPINCSNVDIEISFDNGLSWTIIADNTANDGSFTWNIPPGINSSEVRFKVSCSDNIFFDINNAPVTIGTPESKCFTYTNDFPVNIPADQPGIYSSPIIVSDIAPDHIVKDVNITNINATHSAVGDLQINLTSQNGATNILMYDICGSNNNINIGFDDEASSSSIACPPTGGTMYKPQEQLAVHKGIPGNGQWTLSFNDWYAGDGGSINSWTLELCIEQKSTLPLNLLSFHAKAGNEGVYLSWVTSGEKDISTYSVERQQEDGSYTTIGTVSARNKAQEYNYGLMDANPMTGINYYRLKTTEVNGRISYSSIESVDFSRRSHITIFPNPAFDKLTIRNSDQANIISSVSVFDASGREVFFNDGVRHRDPQKEINISTLNPGVYFIQVKTSDSTEVLKFIKS